MLVLAHSGITLGAAVLVNGALSKSRPTHIPSSKILSASNPATNPRTSWLISLANRVDIRILLVGSLLPDIIDKPVGQFFFRETFSNGRIFCHTLFFLLVITLAGLHLYKRNQKTWLLALSFGTFMHLILDQMWLTPRTLLWPLYGWSFKRADLSHWLEGLLASLITEPSVYIPEIIGALVLGIFLWQLIRSGTLNNFIRRGTIQKIED